MSPGTRRSAHTIARLRLVAQLIAAPSAATPADVVAHLTAMQAQDYRGALWAIGLRLPSSTIANVERAVANREIVRTWPMRGTLHFVAAPDVRWMLSLLARRVIKGGAGRRRQIGLDDATFARCRKTLAKALRDGNTLTRDEMQQALERAKILIDGHRAYHILSQLSMEGLLCFAEPRGKQLTFALLDEWIPASRELSREESLAELAARYFRGHGPATVRDFAWWSGLPLGDARAGIALAASLLAEVTIDGVACITARESEPASDAARGVFLLPGFDELLLGYTDRSASLDPEHAQRIVPGSNGVFKPTIISNGRVVGTWRAAVAKGKMVVTPEPFAPLNATATRALRAAVARYERFILGEG